MLVACDTCGLEVPFDQYLVHAAGHRVPPEVRQQHEDPPKPQPIQEQKKEEHELPGKAEELARNPFSGKGTDLACHICLQDYSMGEPLIFLPCMHQFHEVCLLSWIKRQAICPDCQKKVFKSRVIGSDGQDKASTAK